MFDEVLAGVESKGNVGVHAARDTAVMEACLADGYRQRNADCMARHELKHITHGHPGLEVDDTLILITGDVLAEELTVGKRGAWASKRCREFVLNRRVGRRTGRRRVSRRSDRLRRDDGYG